jgi:hypothetical protein
MGSGASATTTGDSMPSRSPWSSCYRPRTPSYMRPAAHAGSPSLTLPKAPPNPTQRGDWWKTSFRTQLGQFEWQVMLFGLKGSSSVLTRVMNAAMTKGLRSTAADGAAAGAGAAAARACGVPGASGPLHRSVVLYMDAMLCYSPSLEEHLKDVREVLSNRMGFTSRPPVSRPPVRIRPLRARLPRAPSLRSGRGGGPAQVRDWPVPTSNADLRRFVGLCNYYRRFVNEYADIAAPLTRLCGPHAPWQWGAEKQQSLRQCFKHCPTTAPVLRTFGPSTRAGDRSLRRTPAKWQSRLSSPSPTTTAITTPSRMTAANSPLWSRHTRPTSLSCWQWSMPCGCFVTTCWAAAPLARPGFVRTSRFGRTTRQSLGCARRATLTASLRAGSTISRSSALTWSTCRAG